MQFYATALTISVSDLSSFSTSQLEVPVEIVTAPNPQSHESGRADENLVDGKLLVEPWNELPDITFASPGGKGQQGPGVISAVGPQTPTDWLYEAESTQAPVSPPPSFLTDSSVPGEQAEQSYTFDTRHSSVFNHSVLLYDYHKTKR